jgi:hypothetical protein
MIRQLDGTIIDSRYAGEQQDIFVLSILGSDYKGTFVDIGCREPINHSNTALLEKYEWKGIAIDINDHSSTWKLERPNSIFIQSNALSIEYYDIFKQIADPQNPIIDYLSIDLDGNSVAFNCLDKVIDTKYEFKIITIEHDAYRGFSESDMIPQRQLLKQQGYILVRQCDIIEDFWINPKYIKEEQYKSFIYINTTDYTPGSEKHFWKHCQEINYDFTKLYK